MDSGDGVEEGDRGDGGGDAPAASVAAVTTRLAKKDGPELADDDAGDGSVDRADGCVGGGLPEATELMAVCVGGGSLAQAD